MRKAQGDHALILFLKKLCSSTNQVTKSSKNRRNAKIKKTVAVCTSITLRVSDEANEKRKNKAVGQMIKNPKKDDISEINLQVFFE